MRRRLLLAIILTSDDSIDHPSIHPSLHESYTHAVSALEQAGRQAFMACACARGRTDRSLRLWLCYGIYGECLLERSYI
jgi:hypothetical protein